MPNNTAANKQAELSEALKERILILDALWAL